MKAPVSRMDFLKGLGVFGAGVAAANLLPKIGNPLRGVVLPEQKGKTWVNFKFIDDPVMNDQLRSYVAQMMFGAADLGECLETAMRIDMANPMSWYDEWRKTADRIVSDAEAHEKANKRHSAGSAWFRAAAYYRAALIHHPDSAGDLSTPQTAAKAKISYDNALKNSRYPMRYVEIPYEGSKMPAYFLKSPTANPKAPVIIFFQGRDAWPEDTKWIFHNAMLRGIHVLGVHAPGQGLAIRLRGLTFRHDWEKAVTPMVDFALKLPGIDPKRIALMGLSMGGALLPRAMAFEHRIKLGIANPGVLNWGESTLSKFSKVPGVLKLYRESPEKFNGLIISLGNMWGTAGWWYRDSAWKHGVHTPHALFQELEKFNNEPIIDKIQKPMLIMDGVGEEFSNGQADKLFKALRSPKEMMLFDEKSTAHLHCQNGGLAHAGERLFNWIEENL